MKIGGMLISQSNGNVDALGSWKSIAHVTLQEMKMVMVRETAKIYLCEKYFVERTTIEFLVPNVV